MAQPGWYPDPSGVPGRFRHWDGSSWSQQTTTDPAHAAAPAHPGQPATPQGRGRNRRGVTGIIVAVAAVLVVALLLRWALGGRGSSSHGGQAPEDTSTAAPSVSAWNERSSAPSATPSDPEPSGGALTSCPDAQPLSLQHPNDGRLHGGHISVDPIQGWSTGLDGLPRWVSDGQLQALPIALNWESTSMVGALDRADGFTTPQVAARGFLDCFASSSFYEGYTGRTDQQSQAVTIDGHPGWWLRSQVRVTFAPDPRITGDTVDIVVLDTGDAQHLSVWEGNATIGDSATQALIDQARASIRVDS